MDENLLVLLEPRIHGSERNVSQPFEFTLEVLQHCAVCLLPFDDEVVFRVAWVDLLLTCYEILLGYIRCLDEVRRVLGLLPSRGEQAPS